MILNNLYLNKTNNFDFVRFILDNENIKEKYQLISFHECDNVIALIGCEQRYRFFVYRVYCL